MQLYNSIAGQLRGALLLAGLGLLGAAAGCTYSHGEPEAVVPCDATPATTTLAAVVWPIIKVNCRDGCHNAVDNQGGVDFDQFSQLQAYAKTGELQRRIKLSTTAPDFMPKGRAKLSACDIERIDVWIQAGALNN